MLVSSWKERDSFLLVFILFSGATWKSYKTFVALHALMIFSLVFFLAFSVQSFWLWKSIQLRVQLLLSWWTVKLTTLLLLVWYTRLFYKIIIVQFMLSHWSMGVFRWEYVNMVVTLQIFVVYVLSDAHFDWLVGNMSMIKKIYFDQEVNKQHFPSFVNLFSRNSL